jgi:phosphoribosylformimino-5-aminoimidazole carboxamide ribotide isomerase
MKLEVLPAIDILLGRVVRLRRGDPSTSMNVSEDLNPQVVATKWIEEGAERLHIIDLDAALGQGSNEAVIKDIIKKSKVPIQVGGGLRSQEKIRNILTYGADRIIIGTLALERPFEITELIEEYGKERIIIALDHKKGFITINGWKKRSHANLFDTFKRFKDLGFNRFLITDVDRDGEMTGPDIVTYRRLAHQAKVIASGGVHSLSDLKELKECGVEATVIGKALYSKSFTLKEAMLEVK